MTSNTDISTTRFYPHDCRPSATSVSELRFLVDFSDHCVSELRRRSWIPKMQDAAYAERSRVLLAKQEVDAD